MSAGGWRDEVPSRPETEERAADDGEALRDRVLNVLLGVSMVLALVLVGLLIGGDLS